ERQSCQDQRTGVQKRGTANRQPTVRLPAAIDHLAWVLDPEPRRQPALPDLDAIPGQGKPATRLVERPRQTLVRHAHQGVTMRTERGVALPCSGQEDLARLDIVDMV